MPILSDLSRRFNMLTTDAKPDPPRIEIKGYTHNLDSNTVNEEAKKKLKFVPPPEPQFEQSNVASSKRKESLLNNSIPTNANSSFTKRDFDDTKYSTADAKQQHKGPNVKTKKRPKQYKYSQGTHVVNYNIINSNGVKIGSRTSYICNVNQFSTKDTETSEETLLKSKVRQMPAEIERLCASTEEITLEDIFLIKTYIGRGWKDVARKLLYSDGQIEQFEENYRFRGISEVIYQIFLDWKQVNTKDAEIGNLINILWTCQEYDCAERLTSARKNSK